MAAATAERSRSATEVWLLGQPEPNPCWGKQLPKNGQVLRRFFHFVRVQRKSVKEAASLVTAEVAVVWEKARIPTQKKSRCVERILRLYASWQNLDRSKKRSAEVDVENRRSFSLALMTLFDIGHADAFDLITVDEDRQFLLGQRCPDGPRGIMQGVDQSLADRERRRLERGVLKRSSSPERATTATRSSSGLGAGDEEENSGDDGRDADFVPSAGISAQSACSPKRRRTPIMTPAVAAALDRTRISDRTANTILAKKRASSSGSKEPAAKKAKKETSPAPEKTTDTFDSDACSPGGDKWNFKIVSWNVNGIRAWLEKDGLDLFKKEDPDIVCIQETKCTEIKIPAGAKPKGYKSYFMSAEKEGYAGVAVYSKQEPVSVTYGIGDEEQDREGRSVTLEYQQFYLVTAYVPNAGRKLVTLPKRMDWDPKFLKHLQELDALKPVIMCGDLNVAHLEIDLANPKSNRKNAGFTKEERDGFTTLLSAGFIDSYRHLYPDKTQAYTFWTYMMNARAKNVGWRLDYFVLSEKLKSSLCDNLIRSSVMGSDHCPITLLMHMPHTQDKE